MDFALIVMILDIAVMDRETEGIVITYHHS